MSLLNQSDGGLDILSHSELRHYYRKPASTEGRNGDFCLHLGHLPLVCEDAHVPELLK